MTSTDLQAALDQIKARADALAYAVVYEGSSDVSYSLKQSQADVPSLIEALEAVLKVHQRDVYDECGECVVQGMGVLYPCPTVRALTDKLTGEDDATHDRAEA